VPTSWSLGPIESPVGLYEFRWPSDSSSFVDDEGVLHTDHELNLSQVPVLRLHYRLEAGT
jgi:hypothetical protein